MAEKAAVGHMETIKGASGGDLFVRHWPVQEPKAVVLLVHGLGEHSGRYAHVGAYLNARGYSLYGFDLRGHGKSSGRRADVRDFDEYLDDTATMFAYVSEKEPERPMFLLGHSMGGTIATLYALRRELSVLGMVLSAPAVKVGSDISPFMIKLAKFLGRLIPTVPLQKLDNRSVSRDPKVFEDYDKDPLNYRGGIRAGLGSAMLKGLQEIEERSEELRLPLLILHGTEDKLTEVSGSKQLYEKAGTQDKELKLYEGLYHEVFNEPEQEEVLGDFVRWLDARLK